MPRNQPDFQVRKFDLTKKKDLDTLSELAGDSLEANLAVGDGYFRIKRYRDALPHLEFAASEGSAEAKAMLSEMYYYGFGVEEDKSEAFRLNTEGAEEGNLYCMYTLGIMYLRGVATEQDVEKAYNLISRAAARRYPQAINVLGTFYMTGTYVERDLKEAERLFREAVSLGDRRAAANLEVLSQMSEGDEAETVFMPKGRMPGPRDGQS